MHFNHTFSLARFDPKPFVSISLIPHSLLSPPLLSLTEGRSEFTLLNNQAIDVAINSAGTVAVTDFNNQFVHQLTLPISPSRLLDLYSAIVGERFEDFYRAASNYSEAALYQVIMLDTRALIPIVHLMYSAFSTPTIIDCSHGHQHYIYKHACSHPSLKSRGWQTQRENCVCACIV